MEEWTDGRTHKITYTRYFVHIVIGYTLLVQKTVLIDEHLLSTIQSYWVTF